MTCKRKRRHAIKLPHYHIEEVKALGHNQEIESYLRSCGIWTQAQNKLKEVYYYVQDESGRRKDFYAAGWLNELGHWQVSSPNFSGSIGHPALSIFTGTDNCVWLFETCFDYLRHPGQLSTGAHIIILNSPHLIQAGLAKAKEFNQTRTFFNIPLPVT